MSVINKMLRDLDSRADEPGMASARQVAPMSVIRGTASTTALPVTRFHHGHRPGRMIPLATLLAALLVAVIWWFGFAGRVLPLPAPLPANAKASATPDVSATSAPAMPAVALIALPGYPMPATVPRPRSLESTKTAQPASTAQLGSPPGAGPASPDTGAVKATPVDPVRGLIANPSAIPTLPVTPAALPQAGLVIAQVAPVPVQPVPAPSAPLAAPAQPAPVLWQDAALDTVGQAQRLWAAGTRDAALELLREAMLVLERAHGTELATTGSVATLALVRELARMELAQGQPAEALALLQKHEWLLPGRADLWALRANAAQRVGQHAQAGEAYRAALQIRPGEPRWLLGAAVSLAAQGQLAAAAELAEQARATQAVSPDVLAYLRQLGVPLRDR